MDHIGELISKIAVSCMKQGDSETHKKDCRDKTEEISIVCTGCSKVFQSRFYYRRRCRDCHLSYNQQHVTTCPECGDSYYSSFSDGRVFDKCYRCYLSTMRKCQKCDRKAYNGFSMCKVCYEDSRNIDLGFRLRVERRKHECTEADGVFSCDLKKCDSSSCDNKTKNRFCVSCLRKYKIIVL